VQVAGRDIDEHHKDEENEKEKECKARKLEGGFVEHSQTDDAVDREVTSSPPPCLLTYCAGVP
jgi:hypothetical protein